MIIEYCRPNTIPEALDLLKRETPVSYALGGGTVLNQSRAEEYAVIDLQALGLGEITVSGNLAQIGATSKLQEIISFEGLPVDLYTSIKHEATYNLRQMATIAGTVVSATGRSPVTTVLLALDASLEILELNARARQVKLGDWLPMRASSERGVLITKVSIPIKVKLAYEAISRTPADQPIVCAAVCQWSSGRSRLALGGWGEAPILAMDGPESNGMEEAAKIAYSQTGDHWASAEYRQAMAGVLALRALQQIAGQ
jgi:CO/xanthine dehydrogenase FAD-binding subunit